MGFPHLENWDGVTAPTVPSGWNNPSGFFATSSGTFGGAFTAGPISSPNVLAIPAGDGGPNAITYASIDTNSGDVTVSGSFLQDVAFGSRSAGIFWRSNASTFVPGTSNAYTALLDFAGATLTWFSELGATVNTIGSTSSITLAANVWYIVAATSTGTTTAITLQRTSDSKYWYSGTWNTSPGNAISGTDSAVTGAGYAGLIGIASLASDIIFDDWSFGASGAFSFSASAGSYAITGSPASLLHARGVPASAGGFTLTGESANLTENIGTISASAGTLSITGESAGLFDDRVTPATVGIFDIVGESATILYPYWLTVSTGSFGITGESATLLAGNVIVASAGNFAISGETADLMPSGLQMAEPGSFTISRIAAELTDDHILFASAGSFTIVGISASIEQPETMNATAGSFSIAGASAGLYADQTNLAGPGSFTITGMPASLIFIGSEGTVEYHVYSNTGAGDPINYSTPIDTTAGLTYTTSPLSYPGVWSFGVRAFWTGSGLEEQNVDAVVTITLNASGIDISNQPPAPLGLRAFATAGSTIRVEWTSPPSSAAKQPVGFHVYTGSPTVNYGAVAATVLYSSGLANSFVANLSGFASGTAYLIGVRAYNGTAEESNVNTVSVTAEGVGPTAVIDLTGTATS